MGLDLIPIAGQLDGFLPHYREALGIREREATRLRTHLMQVGENWEIINKQRSEQKGVFGEPKAGFLEDPARTTDAQSCPTDYCVVATDGSQIALDRHQSAHCYVINVGKVLLRYGNTPFAVLRHEPTLQWPKDEFPQADDEGGDADMVPATAQAFLELERSVAELRELRMLVDASDPGIFTLALVDNSLVLWSPTMDVDRSAVRPLVDAYVNELGLLAEAARTRPLALAGYLSYPASPWVADLLTSTLEDAPNDSTQPPRNERSTRPPSIVSDRELFIDLPEGSRTARFSRQSRLLQSYSDECKVQFFYLNAGSEIARVEIPAWVGNNAELLAMTHSATLQQCRLNRGYPVALMEAHEQAVVSPSESRAFWELINKQLRHAGLPSSESAKAYSKRVPTA